MTNTPLRGQLADAYDGREPLSAEDEEAFQNWATRQPWFLEHQNRTGYAPDLRALPFQPRAMWEALQARSPFAQSGDAVLAGGSGNDTVAGGAGNDLVNGNDDLAFGRQILATGEGLIEDFKKWGVTYSKAHRNEGPPSFANPYSDCSAFGQLALERNGFQFPKNLRTKTFADDPRFYEVDAPQPGDFIVQRLGDDGHVGIFTEMKAGVPQGLQMGTKGLRSGPWGPRGWFDYPETMKFYRAKRPAQSPLK